MPEIRVFTTDRVAQLVGLDKWRVIKFATGEEYGIEPAFGQASGQGTRRLYSLDNVCEIALAVRLLETGFRSLVVGKVLTQARQKGQLSERLNDNKNYLAIFRTPMPGEPLKKKRQQFVEFVATIHEATKLGSNRPQDDMIIVPLGSLFSEIRQRLQEMESKKE